MTRIKESRRPLWLVVLVSLLPVAGCAYPEQGITVDVRSVMPGARPAIPSPDGLKVAVAPFTVERSDSVLAGALNPFVGRGAPFVVRGEDLGQGVSEVFIDDLKRRLGWRTWLDKPGVEPIEGGPDVRLSGQVRECVATADTGLFGTDVVVACDLAMDATNAEDGSRLHFDFKGRISRWIGDFEAREVEDLLNEAIRKTIDQFLAASKVEGRKLVEKGPTSP